MNTASSLSGSPGRRRPALAPLGRVAGLVALLLLTPALSGCQDASEAPDGVRPVRVMRVGDLSEFRGRQFPGRAEPVQFVDLSFRVSGTLQTLAARIGQSVQEGEIIARVDERDFQVRVTAAEAGLARAEAELARAEEEFARMNVAFDRGAASEMEIVRTREARNIAAANVKSLQAELQGARDALADTSLRAPFSGEISARFTENFEDIQARQPVLRVVDNSRIRFTVNIPEQLMAQLDAVEEILCEFEAFPGQELVAEIDELQREADPVTRTFPITLVMDQPSNGPILAGMSGRAWVSRLRSEETETDVFDLPPSAVRQNAGEESFVWLIDESSGVVSRRTVEVGQVSPGGVRVRGVGPGDVVATAGAAFLRDGQRVRILNPSEATPGNAE
ncbi:efflux RND transporter periplasmic adaptor subunit [Nodularia spumigena]|uniref:efflux RND transporter periplasmic adaptor subunit n=1 Tax=Nodularia spumigena TaxID=70799 RepID=UPI002B20592B|nr:efflux RND transporter periplasmic adaptor subunit [Nodularia spumigena]MEA5615108.1 efflux RND transporter periplasmic adaptor subunit [Nodularia spumigena UHCC 0040]